METMIGPWKISIERHWPSVAELAARYDAVSGSWQAQMKRRGYMAAYRELFERLRSDGLFVDIPAGGTLLDVGTGTGAFSLALAHTLRRKLQLYGLDISNKMVTVAQATFEKARIPAAIRVGDVTEIDFADNSFDMVTSAHLLEHLPDPAAGLQEMVRVLKPGAPLILSVTRPGLFGHWIQLRWLNGLVTSRQMEEWMGQSGLRDICVIPFRPGLARWTSLVYVGRKA